MLHARNIGVIRTPRSLVSLIGHSHEGTERFTIWVRRRATGEMERVYESYDPLEPALLTYSSVVQNSEPDRAIGQPGGTSGPVHLDAGDALVWECEIDNVGDEIVRDGAPGPSGGQMCYTFGSFVADDAEGEALWACGAAEDPAF